MQHLVLEVLRQSANRKAAEALGMHACMHAFSCLNVPTQLQHNQLSVAAQLQDLCFPSTIFHLQGAMQALRTPCIQAFLHLLPAGGLLWAFLDVAPLTVGLAKGIAPTAASSALQARSMLMTPARRS